MKKRLWKSIVFLALTLTAVLPFGIFSAAAEATAANTAKKAAQDFAAEGGVLQSIAFWWSTTVILVIIIIALIIALIIKNKKPKAFDEGIEIELETDVEEMPETPDESMSAVVEEPQNITEKSDKVVERPQNIAKNSCEVERAFHNCPQNPQASEKAAQTRTRSLKYKAIINIGTINEHFSDGDTVDLDALKARGLVPERANYLKILAGGALTKDIRIIADSYSKDAKASEQNSLS